MAGKILIISYFTNEDGMACSHHVDDRLSFFRAQGVEPVLLSSSCVSRQLDYRHCRVPSVSPSGIRFELRRSFHKRAKRSRCWKLLRNILLIPVLPFYALERLVVRLDPTWYWQPLAVIYGLWICRLHGVDTIYSTGGPPVAHSVADVVSRWCSIKWLAEVQDPLIHGYCAAHDSELRILRKVEARTCHDADTMIFLTEKAMRKTRERVGGDGNGVVIYPGAILRRNRVDRVKESHLMLAHFGSLGGVRNLETFILGLQQAVDMHPAMEEDLRVDLYGNVGGDDRRRITASSFGHLFSLKGLANRQEALDAMMEYDVLLLIQGVHDISTETIPSKCYEYFLTGRQVLGLLHENKELEKMFIQLGHLAVPAGDVREIAEALCRCYTSWQEGVQFAGMVSPYTVESAVQQLLSL